MKKWMRSQKIKTFLVVLSGLALLAVLLIVGSSVGGVKILTADRASTPEKRVKFLSECGWEVDPASEQAQEILIPERFSPVYEEYNQLQIQQGYDLSDYAGRSCTMYTYTVTNYPDQGQTVLADLYIYKNQVIGGDVHSTNLDGFMIGLK